MVDLVPYLEKVNKLLDGGAQVSTSVEANTLAILAAIELLKLEREESPGLEEINLPSVERVVQVGSRMMKLSDLMRSLDVLSIILEVGVGGSQKKRLCKELHCPRIILEVVLAELKSALDAKEG